MKNKNLLLITIMLVIMLVPSCSKDDLVLDQDYINVSDLCRYLNQKEICEDTTKWVNKEIKIKGYINRKNFQIGNFHLYDIRNGLNVNIYISFPDTSSLIDKINSSDISSTCYIKGVLKQDPYIIIGLLNDLNTFNNNPDCYKVPAIFIYNEQDIFFK